MPDAPAPGGPGGPSGGPDTPQPVQCPICEDEFDDEEELAEHMTAEHG